MKRSSATIWKRSGILGVRNLIDSKGSYGISQRTGSPADIDHVRDIRVVGRWCYGLSRFDHQRQGQSRGRVPMRSEIKKLLMEARTSKTGMVEYTGMMEYWNGCKGG